MSYGQFLFEHHDTNRQGVFSFMRGQCYRHIRDFEGDLRDLSDLYILPEHREPEDWDEPSYMAKPGPDAFKPAPDDLSQLQRIDYEDLILVGKRVLGRHQATVDKPWYLMAQFFVRRLGCTLSQAKQLRDLFEELQLGKQDILDLLPQVVEDGIDESIAYYQGLVEALRDCDPNPEDALEHRSGNGLAHNLPPREVAHDFSPEWALLLEEGVPSAAMIAHDLGISLAQAGEVREAVISQDFEAAQAIFESSSEQPEDDEADDDPEAEAEAERDADFRQFVAEGWHIMDDLDFPPDGIWPWLERQPAHFKVLLHKVEMAEKLDELGQLGKKAYARDWSSDQKRVFWAFWKARRQALLTQTMQRFKRVRKAVWRLQTAKRAELGQVGRKLFQLQKEQPTFYPPEGWLLVWASYRQRKAEQSPEALATK